MSADAFLPPILLTLALAAVTTVLLVAIGTPIAWWLARTQWKGRDFVAAVTALPLVLPPTVLGFYLLVALGPNGPGGWLASLFGLRTLAFSFWGLVIGSVVYSLPFMVQPLRAAFEGISPVLFEAASTLGARPWDSFVRIAVPLARPGLVTGVILSFAHTVGEFGVVLMIGGNIPGQTRVLSIAIFDFVEQGQWREAHAMSIGLVAFAFVVVAGAMLIDRRLGRVVQ